MQDLQEALTLAHRERDTATEEKQEAQRSQSTTLELVRSLQIEVHDKDERLMVLRQKYSHVDQEYRRLIFEIGGTT